MIAACYDLRLECDGEGCAAGECGLPQIANVIGEHGSSCRRLARAAGWRLLPDGLCLCPACVKRGAKPATAAQPG